MADLSGAGSACNSAACRGEPGAACPGCRHFEQDELRQTWFLRHLQIIGEAARALPDDVRSLAPEIPWSKIIGMRNVLVHGYFDVDTDIVWQGVRNDVPALKLVVLLLLQRIEHQR